MSRTTLDLDADLLRALKRLALESDDSMTRVANRAVRAGLAAMAGRPQSGVPTVTPVDLGACRIPLDNVAEALAIAEGDAHP